jgi:hypothetical protein
VIKILKGAGSDLEIKAIEQALLMRTAQSATSDKTHGEYGKPILRTSIEPESAERS